jgi:hypothetical protein
MYPEFDVEAKAFRKHRAPQFSYRARRLAGVLLLLSCLILFTASRREDGLSFHPSSIPSLSTIGLAKKPRVAIVTFVTNQNSYMHLSLRNKARK